ncbi:MAG: AmmeMemoRadiSam system protein A [Treponema sp.]|jgi:AmmeMemoRadiSam system protein A|nr:AmmeMemoRadiSam system protein A [Treponema sp.]
MNVTISAEEQARLLAYARETITARLEDRLPEYRLGEAAADSALNAPCGAFVTLHIGTDLRGCIGSMTAHEALEHTVCGMALKAAFGDPRFPPLTREEATRCRIEVSALSPMTRCDHPYSIEIGVHGLYLSHQGRVGVFLPQVPVEQGWDVNEYLNYLCAKAGLPAGAFKATGAELYTFTAVVFGEAS